MDILHITHFVYFHNVAVGIQFSALSACVKCQQ